MCNRSAGEAWSHHEREKDNWMKVVDRVNYPIQVSISNWSCEPKYSIPSALAAQIRSWHIQLRVCVLINDIALGSMCKNVDLSAFVDETPSLHLLGRPGFEMDHLQ